MPGHNGPGPDACGLAWVGLAPSVGAIFTAPDVEFNIDAYLGEMSELSQIMELRRGYLTQQTIA